MSSPQGGRKALLSVPDSKKQAATEATHLLGTPTTHPLSVCSLRSFARDPLATRSIDWVSVAFLSYFNVCGGPWGSETIISSGGPLFGLLGILVFAIASGLPMILVTAELSSMYPDDGGYSIWVAEAFGEFWGFQESYWSWFSGLLDNCLYPVITFRLIQALCFPQGLGFWMGWVCKSLLCVIFSMPNVFFVNMVGHGLAGAFAVVILPFIILIINAVLINPGDPRVLLERIPSEEMDWGHFLNILYWNVSGFDCISTCAGEVKNPGNSLLKGLLLCLILVVLTYILPLAALASVNTPPWYSWREGDFTVIAAQQVGDWLAPVVICAGAVGNMGMHVAELFEDSWQLHGMAKCGLAPSVFKYKHPQLRTPLTAVAFSTLLMVMLVSLNFERLMMIDNFFSVSSGLLEYAAFLKLRHSKPFSIRPFRIPINFCGCVVLVLVASSSAVFVLYTSVMKSGVHLLIDSAAVVAGFVFYFCTKLSALEYQRPSLSSVGSHVHNRHHHHHHHHHQQQQQQQQQSHSQHKQHPDHDHSGRRVKAPYHPPPIYQQSNEERTTPPAQVMGQQTQLLASSLPSEQCFASSTRATPGTPLDPEQAVHELLSSNLSRSPLQLPNSHLERELSDIPETKVEGRALGGEGDMNSAPHLSVGNSRLPLLSGLREARIRTAGAEKTRPADDDR